MAKIGPGFKALLDRSRPRPVVGTGYLVEVRSRDAVRYIEEDRSITMFSDLIHRTDEPYWGNKLSRLLFLGLESLTMAKPGLGGGYPFYPPMAWFGGGLRIPGRPDA